jgi:hypothetical protein
MDFINRVIAVLAIGAKVTFFNVLLTLARWFNATPTLGGAKWFNGEWSRILERIF